MAAAFTRVSTAILEVAEGTSRGMARGIYLKETIPKPRLGGIGVPRSAKKGKTSRHSRCKGTEGKEFIIGKDVTKLDMEDVYGCSADRVWVVMVNVTTEVSQITRMVNNILRSLDFILEMGR